MRDPLVLVLVFIGIMAFAIFFGPRLKQRPPTYLEQLESIQTSFDELAYILSHRLTPVFQSIIESLGSFAAAFESVTDTFEKVGEDV